jgi:hypothetical protein
LNTYLGTNVSLEAGGKGECFYWKPGTASSDEIIIYFSIGLNYFGKLSDGTEICGIRNKRDIPCHLVSFKDPGTVANYAISSGGGIWVNVLQHGWCVAIAFEHTLGGVQATLKKVQSLTKAMVPLPAAPTTTTTTTIPTTPITSLSCSSFCAFAVGDRKVALSWPDSDAAQYTLAIYFNGVFSGAYQGVGVGSGAIVVTHGGEDYYEFAVNKDWCSTCGVGTTVSFEYFAGNSGYVTLAGTWTGSAMSNSVVVK